MDEMSALLENIAGSVLYSQGRMITGPGNLLKTDYFQ